VNLSGIIKGIFSIPALFKKPSVKVWLPLYLINCLFNLIFDKYLVKTGKLKYPIKLIPKMKLRINFVYDFFGLPLYFNMVLSINLSFQPEGNNKKIIHLCCSSSSI
jgi:hypothetical protein